MKRLVSFAFLGAVLLIPAVASAQGYYGPPRGGGYGGYYAGPPQTLPGGYFDRTGRLALGFSIGLGAMKSNAQGDIGCNTCNYNPAALEVDFHVGGMLAPQFALLFEMQGNLQTIDDSGGGTVTLSQGTAMIAGQYWLSPKFWIKGGIGAAHLSYDFTDQFGNGQGSQPIDNGAAIMGALGYEVYSTREFALDLQGRLIEGSYKGIDDQITSGTIGLGFNWY